MRQHAEALSHNCADAQCAMRRCADAPMRRCAEASLYQCANVPMRQCATARGMILSMRHCVTLQPRQCATTRLHHTRMWLTEMHLAEMHLLLIHTTRLRSRATELVRVCANALQHECAIVSTHKCVEARTCPSGVFIAPELYIFTRSTVLTRPRHSQDAPATCSARTSAPLHLHSIIFPPVSFMLSLNAHRLACRHVLAR